MAQSISPISIKGTKLYESNGDQFFIKGVAYAPSITYVIDPLARPSQCQVDAGMMKSLGVNTIRVYTVDPTLNHDACMQSFASQGIYVALDLATPTSSINRADPEWTLSLFNHYASTIDAFSKYNNTLMYFVGNEVVNANATTASPVIKAAARDMKEYRDARGYRKIPIAYSASDDRFIRQPLSEYLACGPQEDSIEIYAMNTYSWCGNSSYYLAGYNTVYEQFQGLNIPVFFSETGCNAVARDFSDVSTMLGPVFQAVFSGAIVYSWSDNASSGYGLVSYDSSNSTGFPTTLSDFGHLSTVLAATNPTGTSKNVYTPSNSVPACPTTDQGWSIQANAIVPTISGLNLATVTALTTYINPSASNTGAKPSATGIAEQGASTDANQNKDIPGLSTGAEAGIVIGAVVIVFAVSAAIYFFVIRKRRSASRETADLIPEVDNESDAEKPELPAKSIKRYVPKSELEASSPQFWQAYYRNKSTAELEIFNPPKNMHTDTYELYGRPLGTVHEIG